MGPSEKHVASGRLDLAAGTDDTRYHVLPPGTWELEYCLLVDNDGIVGHASNYRDFNVFGSDGSTLAYNRDTNSGGDGSMTAGAGEAVTQESGLGTNARFTSTAAAPAEVKVDTVESASGVAVDWAYDVGFVRVPEL